ncbi:Uncharacterised protein [uncultured archaeon]|nr:Uncharacterised protein [uncultured archaeon]
MVIKVSEDALKKTKCKKDFSCLSGERTDLCMVEYCVNGEIHFLRCMYNSRCGYQIPFGYSSVCTCPVRKELYNRYKI